MAYRCSYYVFIILLANKVWLCLSLDNGLALTPPMGWISYERFRWKIDCDDEPYNCMGELLFKTTGELKSVEFLSVH